MHKQRDLIDGSIYDEKHAYTRRCADDIVDDLSAWVLAVESRVPGVELELVARFWLPEERDYGAIEKQIIAECRRLDVQRISYDQMFAGQLVQRIEAKTRGVDVVPIARTYLGMPPGSKELERFLREGQIRHDGNPALRRNASVVEVYRDGNDNPRSVKPDHLSALALRVPSWYRDLSVVRGNSEDNFPSGILGYFETRHPLDSASRTAFVSKNQSPVVNPANRKLAVA
ncbi:terminase TerL endonuclease subunit [Streptomyces sp. NPDC056773]|uniref:terminase TerL endonuclease subunit n=1 Tax=unclassified Streptomyces TaxID=2593676 RepID=UPI00369325B7